MTLNTFKVCSLNTIGIRNKNKHLAIFEWLEHSNQHVLLLQETHSSSEIENEWKQELNNRQSFFSHGTTSAKGVCISIPSKYDTRVITEISDHEGRFLISIQGVSNVWKHNKEKLLMRKRF